MKTLAEPPREPACLIEAAAPQAGPMQRNRHEDGARRDAPDTPRVGHLPRQQPAGAGIAPQLEAPHELAADPREAQRRDQLAQVAQRLVAFEAAAGGRNGLAAPLAPQLGAALQLAPAGLADRSSGTAAARAHRGQHKVQPRAEQLACAPANAWPQIDVHPFRGTQAAKRGTECAVSRLGSLPQPGAAGGPATIG